MVHRHGFLCATPQVQIGVGFQQSLGAGIFGGDGFRLQHINGSGTAWIELSGEVITKDLRSGRDAAGASRACGRVPDQRQLPDLAYSGISNMIFGGDGIFLAALTGPGGSGCSRCRSQVGACAPRIPAQLGRAARRSWSGRWDCWVDFGWDEVARSFPPQLKPCPFKGYPPPPGVSGIFLICNELGGLVWTKLLALLKLHPIPRQF